MMTYIWGKCSKCDMENPQHYIKIVEVKYMPSSRIYEKRIDIQCFECYKPANRNIGNGDD